MYYKPLFTCTCIGNTIEDEEIIHLIHLEILLVESEVVDPVGEGVDVREELRPNGVHRGVQEERRVERVLLPLGPNSIGKNFGFSFGLKNHLNFVLRFPPLRSSSKIHSLDMSQSQNGISVCF